MVTKKMLKELVDKAVDNDILQTYGTHLGIPMIVGNHMTPLVLKLGNKGVNKFIKNIAKKNPVMNSTSYQNFRRQLNKQVLKPTIGTGLGWGLMKTNIAMPQNKSIGGSGHPVKGVPTYMMSRRKGWEKK